MLTIVTGERWSLVSGDQHMLFLEKRDDPEVPRLCEGLQRVVDGGERFLFTPVDERDFQLEATSGQNGVIVHMQFDQNAAAESFGWPNGVLVSHTEIRKFIGDLRKAYEALGA